MFPHLAKFTYVLLEYDSERAGGFEPLADLPPCCGAVLGLVTTKAGDLERPEDLMTRIDQAAQIISRERIAISPQCGFASDAGGNPITAEQQTAKLKLVGDIAHSVLG